MSKTDRDRNLESFDWLPIGSWSVENLTGPTLGSKSMCKVCDKYIATSDAESHIKKHLKEYERLKKKKKLEASERRKETLRKAREDRKNKKDRDDRERAYREGELDE